MFEYIINTNSRTKTEEIKQSLTSIIDDKTVKDRKYTKRNVFRIDYHLLKNKD